MKNYKCFFLSFLIYSSLGYSQKEANVWYFGTNAGMNFNTGSPVALTDGLATGESSCISDSNGNLLFYTNGINVWNKNHNVMPNGDGLEIYGVNIIVPQPGNPSVYYIFGTNFYGDTAIFGYSVVDMNLAGGLGGVVTKNSQILTSVCTKVAVVKHANSVDYWVIIHQWGSNAFYSYLLNSMGINNAPVVSNIGSVHSGLGIGWLKASPKGNRLALAKLIDDIYEVYDFDNSTGNVSNVITLNAMLGNSYGVEFSSDGNKLYVSHDPGTFNRIYQYDLLSADINGSKSPIVASMNNGSGGGLQLGPDGKIYFARTGSQYLGVINNPNADIAGCNYVHDGFYLGGKTGGIDLSYFVADYFSTLSTGVEYLENKSFELLPNPFSNYTTFQFFELLPTQDLTFILTDVLGREVKKITNISSKEFIFHRNEISSGLYYFHFTNEKQVVAKGSLVIN